MATQKSWDTMKLSVDDNIYIYIKKGKVGGENFKKNMQLT